MAAGRSSKSVVLKVGDPAPDVIGRTDEGTPISLADLRGRALAVFLFAKSDAVYLADYVEQLVQLTEAFLELDCSPVVVVAADEEEVSAVRAEVDPPFVLISDPGREISGAFGTGGGAKMPGAWLIDVAGLINAAIPAMRPREQVNATLAALERTVAG